MPVAPSNEEGLRIYQRLLGGDPTAPADLAETYLDPLTNWLAEHNSSVDPDLCTEAASEAIVSLIKKPASYQPERLPLEAYLRMSAQGDLKNALDREKRHRTGRKTLESVEHSEEARKYLGKEDDPSLQLQITEEVQEARDAVPRSVWEGLTEQEVRVLELMIRKERKTQEYAKAYGIENLPEDEQRMEIKQVKDRLQKRWDRARG
jgi:RNA polymerase sigma factor (sigma-70 family)